MSFFLRVGEGKKISQLSLSLLLSFSLSSQTNRLLKIYASLDGGRLRALVACVKHWAKRRAVNDPYR